jgi:hypothetical protein
MCHITSILVKSLIFHSHLVHLSLSIISLLPHLGNQALALLILKSLVDQLLFCQFDFLGQVIV